jgi:hypothetical protein
MTERFLKRVRNPTERLSVTLSPSVRVEELRDDRTDFHDIDTGEFYETSSAYLSFQLNTRF